MGDIQVQNNLYANYDNWNKNVAMAVGDNFENAEISNLTAFEVAEGYGQNPENYKSSFLQLAKENIDAYDTDKSGNVDFYEYLENELAQYNELYGTQYEYNPEQDYIETESKETSEFFGEFLSRGFGAMDINNNDGVIDEKELAAFYSTLDVYGDINEFTDENGNKGTDYHLDGKIEPEATFNWSPVDYDAQQNKQIFNTDFIKPFKTIYQYIFQN